MIPHMWNKDEDKEEEEDCTGIYFVFPSDFKYRK